MDKPKVFKFTCEYLVRANTKEEAERKVKEEFGHDVYESHILLEDVTPTCGGACLPVDLDLTK